MLHQWSVGWLLMSKLNRPSFSFPGTSYTTFWTPAPIERQLWLLSSTIKKVVLAISAFKLIC